MPFEVQVHINASGIKQIKDGIYYGTDDYVQELTDHAKDLAKFGKYATGETEQSIANEVEEVGPGVRAKVFTQSGHGGYLEVGTKRMKAEPFLFPAFQRTMNDLAQRIKSRLS